MIFYRSKLVFSSLDHMCSVVYDVNAENKYDISILVAFLKGVLVLCFLTKCEGFLVYNFVVDFQVSVDSFVLKSIFLNFF